MNNKITPKDVYSNSLIVGDFKHMEMVKHYDNTKDYSKFRFRPIDTNKFGSYFAKCVDRLNSIVKTGTLLEEGDLKAKIVVKDRIGIDMVNNLRGSKRNNIYSRVNTLYAMLHSGHSDLVCKKEKGEMVKDFWNIKSDFIMKFHDLKRLAMDYVNESITVSDAFDISYALPESPFRKEHIGHMILNNRVIKKENVFVTVDDENFHYSSYLRGIPTENFRNFGRIYNHALAFACFIKEKDGLNVDGSQGFKNICLFRVTISGNNYSKAPSISIYSNSFDGIDLNGMITALSDEVGTFHDAFDDRLEELKQKYSANFLLSEICDPSSNCAI